MANTITKALIGKEDLKLKESGTTKQTFTRTDASSRTLTLEQLDAAHLQFRTIAKSVDDLVDGGYDVAIKPSKIFGGSNNTSGHSVPNIADDTFALLAAAQTFTNKTLTAPVISGGSLNNSTISTPTITGGTISAATISGATITAPTVSGGTVDGATISNCTFDGNTYSDETPVVQQVSTVDGAVNEGITPMPYDDTIPLNTEGDEYMTLAITPKNSSNKLKIEIVGNFSSVTTDHITMALFQDSTANALAATAEYVSTAAKNNQVTLTYTMTAGTTSSTTFKMRAGITTGDGLGFNGVWTGGGGTRKFGGVYASSIVITEYKI